jgi:hypothetical protein
MERNDRMKPTGSRIHLFHIFAHHISYFFSLIHFFSFPTLSDMYQQVDRVSNDRGNKRQKRDDHNQPPREDHPLLKRMAGCWFCLSNPEVEKHLIVSIGEECYLTLAKGGLTPHHSLIVPIAHAGATTMLEDATMEEIGRYKDAIRRCFEAQQMGVVFVEHYLPTKQNTVHCVIQVAPMTADVCVNAQKQFETAAKELDMELAILESHETLKSVAGDRFYICTRNSVVILRETYSLMISTCFFFTRYRRRASRWNAPCSSCSSGCAPYSNPVWKTRTSQTFR